MTNSKQLFTLNKFILFFFSLIILTSCNPNNDPITIHFFKSDNPVIFGSINKDEKDGWEPLMNIDLSQSDFVINEDNILSYELKTQKFIIDGKLKESFGYDNFLPDFAYFVITLGKSPVIGGILLPHVSAVGNQIPILYISDSLFHPNNPGMEMYISINGYITTPDNPELLTDIHNRLAHIDKLSGE